MLKSASGGRVWRGKRTGRSTGTLTKLKDDSVTLEDMEDGIAKDPATALDRTMTTSCSSCFWRCRTGWTDTATAISIREWRRCCSTAPAAIACLVVPDLIAVSELAQADGGGHTFGKVWDDGQFRLLPHNASPLRPWGHPYGAVRARAERGEGFTSGEANFRLTGVWGYRLFAEASGATLTAEAAAEDTGITVSDGAQFRVGQTLLLGGGGDATASEQVLVTGVDGNGLSVSRGLNGSSAETHASGGGVGILRWPASVERAALIQAARIWTRAADFEPFYVDADVDTDVRLLLEPYRRVSGV